MPGSKYGAAITPREYIRVSLAAGVGSVLEWFDYTLMSAMSPIIQQNFFPPGDLAAKQLSFWSVYAVGYLFRPLGSLIFGHICDVLGRRLSLMITLVMMAVPTVLIGCLPSYEQAGLAAPILLSLLRVVQGIAVGGELGTAVVFMHELAPAKHKSKAGSIVFIGVTTGIMMALILSMIVSAAIPPAALLHWGWRIPFLLAFITAVVGLMLRYHMPESYEFEHDPVKAANRTRTLRRLSRASSNCSCTVAPDDHQQQQHTQPLAAGSKSVLNGSQEAGDLACSIDASTTGLAGPQADGAAQAGGADATSRLGCWASCQLAWGHDPIKMLFRDHWREVLLLFWFETWTSSNFYAFFAWVPSYMTTNWKIALEVTQGMTLANMSITLGIIPFVAHLADRGMPRLRAAAVILGVAAVVSVPMMLAISTQKLVAAWLCQMLDLFMNAAIFGFLPTIGSVLFPVHVRATGYNFAHTSAQSWLGGLTPVLVSAINYRLQQSAAPAAPSIYLVSGIFLTVCACISLIALAIMWRMFPQTNKDPPGSTSPQSVLPVTEKAPAAAAM